MESWIPLLEIFLNSACPENEASKWLQEMFDPSSNSNPISTTSFLSLLTRPSGIQRSSPQEKRTMWIQTLPGVVQARILSFLAYEHQRFCKKELCRLSRILLSEGEGVDFWVKKSAQHLLDLVSVSNYQWLSHLNLDSEEENVDEAFYSMPDWLRDAARDSEMMFPWLPMSADELSDKMPFPASEGDEDDNMEENKQDHIDEVMHEGEPKFDVPVDTEVEKVAKSLKTELLNVESSLKAVDLAREIHKLCSENRVHCLVILNLIEPWNAEDETAAVLISHFCDGNEGDESDWFAHVLCSIVLPKFLALKEPPSRVLVDATVDYCKAHQRVAEYALLLPLILRNDGINNPICDVISRIVKESLHPAHVSSFCQKLLTEDQESRRLICLGSQRCLISVELVWTEALFSLWRSILDHNVHLMQESVVELVNQVCKYSSKYSKSLKFGHFVLCLVNKCGPMLRPHKVLLKVAIEKSDTLLTKSILSKLSAL